MSSIALESDGTIIGADQATKQIRESLNAAREDRKRFEATWQSNLAFAAGKFWLKWDRDQRRLILPSELQRKELYAADVITEYRTTALGELGSDDDRPELLLRRDDQASEDFQQQLNRAVAWGWDYEWRGDDVLEEMRRLCIDLGTAAIRCRFDPTVGPAIAESVPYSNGKPVLDLAQASELFSNGPNPDVQMRPMQRGSIKWEPLSPFNMLVPPGVPNERDFPWEAVHRPVPLEFVRAEYGSVAEDLKEDTDIGSILGLDVQAEIGDSAGLGTQTDGKSSRLRGQVWLTTYYERPTPRYPQGRTVTFAGGKMKPLRIEERLPYQAPDGSYCSGIVYFHWWRVSGRFWSRALVEAMKDVQRSVNKRRTQINEIIDRGLPVVFVQKNSPAKERRGLAMELIEIGEQERQPIPTQGIGPGEWMYHDIQEMRVDLEHATGIRGPRLGENPTNVTTYAQLALLNENDQVKRSMILREHKSGIAKLVESSVYDIRSYWGAERQISLAGDDDEIEAHVFDATKVPEFFIVKVAKGSAKPRSQAAELQKIEEIWNAALNSGAAAPAPQEWVAWLKDSLENGQSVELPDMGASAQEDKASLENHYLLAGTEPAFVQYYDPSAVHIPIHRSAQIQAEQSGDLAAWSRIEMHVQAHVLQDQKTAMHMAQMMPMTPPPMAPGPEQPGAGAGAPPGAPA